MRRLELLGPAEAVGKAGGRLRGLRRLKRPLIFQIERLTQDVGLASPVAIDRAAVEQRADPLRRGVLR